jgi:hypothetical protein
MEQKHKFRKSDQNQTKISQSIKTNTTYKPNIVSQSTKLHEEGKVKKQQKQHRRNMHADKKIGHQPLINTMMMMMTN